MRANYHTHCDFCDGKASAAEMASAAFDAGYRVLGFSSHSPLPWKTPWSIEGDSMPAYAAEVRRLARDWRPRGMEILLGMEIEWIPGVSGPKDGIYQSLGLDYRLASTHYVNLPGLPPFTVDEGSEEFAGRVAALGGDPTPIWNAYWKAMAAMIGAGGFDILGHLDLVRKNNGENRYFDARSRPYLKAALEAVDLLHGTDIVVEINYGGMVRYGMTEPYPSLPLLRHLRGMGVRITLDDDAHRPEQLGSMRSEAREHARTAGYRSVAILSGGSWREVGIDET